MFKFLNPELFDLNAELNGTIPKAFLKSGT